MVFIKDPDLVERFDHRDFDTARAPGAEAPHAGIYRCTVCGFEVAARRGDPLPATEFCATHADGWDYGPGGRVMWRLVAAARDHVPRLGASTP